MRNLIRYFYANRMKIIGIVIAIILGILLLQVLNNLYKNKDKTYNSTQTVDYNKDYAIISDSRKSERKYNEEKTLMQQFTSACMSKSYEEAYNLLTDECKEIFFPNIETFINNYCNSVFPTEKSCSFQAWTKKTYLVEVRDDPLSTGVYSENYMQDYYTIDGDKLNIKSFIGREILNNKESSDNVTVKVNYIDYYIDYTKVNVTVVNLRDASIVVDMQEKEKSIAIEDEKGIQYSSNVNEYTRQDLIVGANTTKDYEFRFEIGKREDLDYRNIIFKGITLQRGVFIDEMKINI